MVEVAWSFHSLSIKFGMSNERPMISILIPCYNEEQFIEDCLRSVLSFEVPAGQQIEILVLDGRSTDGSRDIVERFTATDERVRLIDNPQRIQSCGLNLGIRQSRGEWIMRLDAHAQYPSNYLRLCHQTALETGADNVGGICITKPGGKGYQAKLIQALTTHMFGVGDSGFRTKARTGLSDTVPFGYFRRSVFNRLGYFDERLVRTEDYEFNRRLSAAGGQIYLNPEIKIEYFNNPDLSNFLRKQLLIQGPYCAYMWHLAPYAFKLRHAITGCFAIFFWAGLILSFISPMVRLFYWSVMTLYACLALLASMQQSKRYSCTRHLFFLPIGFLLFHLCHGTGVLLGLGKIARGTAPVQSVNEPWPRC